MVTNLGLIGRLAYDIIYSCLMITAITSSKWVVELRRCPTPYISGDKQFSSPFGIYFRVGVTQCSLQRVHFQNWSSIFQAVVTAGPDGVDVEGGGGALMGIYWWLASG